MVTKVTNRHVFEEDRGKVSIPSFLPHPSVHQASVKLAKTFFYERSDFDIKVVKCHKQYKFTVAMLRIIPPRGDQLI